MPALARICERAPSAATRRRVAVTLPSANSTSRYCEEPDGDSHPPLEGRAIAYENRKANKTESSLEQIAEKRLRFPVRSCTCDSPALVGRVGWGSGRWRESVDAFINPPDPHPCPSPQGGGEKEKGYARARRFPAIAPRHVFRQQAADRPVRRQLLVRPRRDHGAGTLVGQLAGLQAPSADGGRGRHRLHAADRPLERLRRRHRLSGHYAG